MRNVFKYILQLLKGSPALKEPTFTVTKPITWTGYRVSDLILKRKWYTDNSTVGELYLGDQFLCYVLEDTLRRGVKVEGKTAIPAGKYEVIINFSDRFKKMMPLLLDVPGFTGVRIHAGNTPANTEGCLLAGLDFNPTLPDYIGRSRDAFNIVFPIIEEHTKSEKLFISIANLGKEART